MSHMKMSAAAVSRMTGMSIDDANRVITEMKREPQKVAELPRYLQGPGTDRWGGSNLKSIAGFRGSKYGPASEGRRLTAEEIKKWKQANRIA
jgi:hypothetical protein